jgi:4'-phosphopantetheinyl transferase
MSDLPFEWHTPPDSLALPDDEVHIWCASLALSRAWLQHLRASLSADELHRVQRFHFQVDRDRFIAARGVLRTILARYVNMEPGQLRFCYDPGGKPRLARDQTGGGLSFNLSHSHDLALYAFVMGREIGVDVERVRREPLDEGLAERFFAPAEVAALRALPVDRQVEAFYHVWTRKEAYLKARGEGLLVPLDEFEVSVAPDAPAALLRVQGNAREAARWTLRTLYPTVQPDPALAYVAALAVEGHSWKLRCWQWSPV